MRVVSLFALVSLLINGCASMPAGETGEFSAEQLGIAFYYPQANLKWKQVARDRYVATVSVGKPARPPSGQDAFLVTPLEILTYYCPAWRLAQRDHYAKATIRWMPRPLGVVGEQLDIAFASDQAGSDEAKGDGRVESVRFLDESFRIAKETLCERTSELNRQW